MNPAWLITKLQSYSSFDDIEQAHQDNMLGFVTNNKQYWKRELEAGHVTASAWLINKEHTHALLTHHRKLDRWLQLGGHIEDDNDDNVLTAALRETREESGLSDISIISEEIFDIDVHPIPASPKEAAHFHYDVRFVFGADHLDELTISHESKNRKWFTLEEIAAMRAGPTIDRMLQKMLAM